MYSSSGGAASWFKTKFYWQEGYGAFSHSRSQISNICKYIKNQPIHHKKRSFQEEYLDFLKKFNVDFDERYLFDFFDSTGRPDGAWNYFYEPFLQTGGSYGAWR